nr:hypothetical protein JVH1_6938 [Rhodococcus sp. JVH1]
MCALPLIIVDLSLLCEADPPQAVDDPNGLENLPSRCTTFTHVTFPPGRNPYCTGIRWGTRCSVVMTNLRPRVRR